MLTVWVSLVNWIDSIITLTARKFKADGRVELRNLHRNSLFPFYETGKDAIRGVLPLGFYFCANVNSNVNLASNPSSLPRKPYFVLYPLDATYATILVWIDSRFKMGRGTENS